MRDELCIALVSAVDRTMDRSDSCARRIHRGFAGGDRYRYRVDLPQTLARGGAGSDSWDTLVFRERTVCFVPFFALDRSWFPASKRADPIMIVNLAWVPFRDALLPLGCRIWKIQTQDHSVDQIGHHFQCIG